MAAAKQLSRDGWKLVPIEPTETMKQAGDGTGLFENDYPRDSREAAAEVWRVMLESAPHNKEE